MRFASCRVLEESIIFFEFEKDYNRFIPKGVNEVPLEDIDIVIKQYDFVDLIVPSKDVLYFSKKYPPVKQIQLEKIIYQDIESMTPFKSDNVIFDFISSEKDGESTVFVTQKKKIVELIQKIGPEGKDKIRTIVPEEVFFFRSSEEISHAIFIGQNYSAYITREGQVIRNKGFGQLWQHFRELFGNNADVDENEFERWLHSMGDVTNAFDPSEDEIRVRKAVVNFFEELMSEFAPFITEDSQLSVFLSRIIPGKGDEVIGEKDALVKVVPASQQFQKLNEMIDQHTIINFAKDEFVYKGGFNFYLKTVAAAIVLFLVAFIIIFISLQMKLGYLNDRAEKIEENSHKITKEVLGKEYPSLRQALSIMMKTIKGDGVKSNKKKIYPYSGVYIMEQVFPTIAFEGSTIEVKSFSIKNGKVRIAGEASTLPEIDKMLENLNNIANITDINKGQITNRRGKNAFSISFEFEKPKPKVEKDTNADNKGTKKK